MRAVRTVGGARLYFSGVPYIMVTHTDGSGGVNKTQYELDDQERLGIFDDKGVFQPVKDGIAVAVRDTVWVRFSAESSCDLHVQEDRLEADGVFSPPDVSPAKTRATIAYEG